MPSSAEVDALRATLDDLSILAVTDIAALWAQIDGAAAASTQAFLTDSVPVALEPYIIGSADIAATWYDELADTGFEAVPADPPPSEQIEASVRWAMGPLFGRGAAPVMDLLSGMSQRYVMAGARDTLTSNAAREGALWARHASATACAFCRLLATRGAVYRTRTTAMRSHDNCHCMPVPIRSGDSYDPPSYTAEWERQYNAARSESDGSTAGILAAMRRT